MKKLFFTAIATTLLAGCSGGSETTYIQKAVEVLQLSVEEEKSTETADWEKAAQEAEYDKIALEAKAELEKAAQEAEAESEKATQEAEVELKKEPEGLEEGGSQQQAQNKSYSTYEEACKNNDFEAARNKLGELYAEYIKAKSNEFMLDYGTTYSREFTAAKNNYYKAFDYIYNAEARYLVVEKADESTVDKMMLILQEIPILGTKAPEGRDYYSRIKYDYKEYIEWVSHYNRLCDKIMTLAIDLKNKPLATAILMQYQDNIDFKEDKVDDNYKIVKYVRTDYEAAKAKYKEAVELGFFE